MNLSPAPMKSFRPMLVGLLLGVAALVAIAASVKISDLPLSSTPSTNTFLEIADMDAVTKSSKYLLTNLQTHLTSAAVQGILGQVYQATNANLTALAGNPNIYQATNAALTALAANPNLYQATNSTLTQYSTIPTNTFANKALDTAYRTLWISAGAMVPSSTNGASPGTWRVTGSDDYVKDVLDFNDTTSQSSEFTISLPPTWNNGTVLAKLYWVSTTATSGTNVWSVAGGAASAGDAFGAILGTAVTATNAVQNATNKVNVVTTGAITVGGTPAADDLIFFKVSRLPGDAYDTTAGDARLLGVKLQYLDALYGGSSW